MKTILVAAALAAVWSGAPATAQTPAATRIVAIHDLDLSRSADVARLDRRVAVAARLVCAEPGSAVYGNYAATKSCERATRQALAPQREAAVEAAKGVALAAR